MLRKLLKGATATEALVASGVMVAVIVVSFDVMASGAKISKATVNETTTQNKARTGADLLLEDITNAEGAVVGVGTDYGKIDSDKDNLVLMVPKRATDGTLLPNEKLIVHYYWQSRSDKENKPGVLIRHISPWSNGTVGATVEKTEIMANVKKAEWKYKGSIQTQVATEGGTDIILPGPATIGSPSNNEIGIEKITIASRGIVIQPNVASVLELLSSLNVSGGAVNLSTPLSTSEPIDVEFVVDPKHIVTTHDKNAANVIDYKIEIHKKAEDDSEDLKYNVTGQALMRNR